MVSPRVNLTIAEDDNDISVRDFMQQWIDAITVTRSVDEYDIWSPSAGFTRDVNSRVYTMNITDDRSDDDKYLERMGCIENT